MATYNGQVTGGGLNLRASASTSATILNQIPNNTQIVVSDYSGNSEWYCTTYSSYSGFVMKAYVTLLSAVATQSGQVTGGGLNLRSYPSTSAPSPVQIPNTTSITVATHNPTWYSTTYSGNSGFVMSQYVTITGGGTPPSGTLREGDSGQEVRNLQTRLNALLYDCGTVDGQFGRRTTWAVKYFQFKNGLSVDGIAGPITLTALNSTSPVKGISSTIENWSANQAPQFFAQTDSLWSSYPYDATGTSNVECISDAGCGPSAMSMVVSTLAKKAVLPPVLGDWALANNYRDPAGIDGTRFSFFAACAANYGLTSTSYTAQSTANLQSVRTHCNNGGLAVVNVFSASPYTSAGHYIVIYKIDSSDKIYVKNPNPSTGESVGTISQWVNGGWFGGIACIRR